MNSIVHEIVKKHLTPEGQYIYGFADLTGLLGDRFIGYNYGISIGRRLDDAIVDGIKELPTLEYYCHYTNINEQLRSASDQIVHELRKAGIGAVAIKPTITSSSGEFDKYLPTLRYEVSHKMVATRAGLGWIGKTDLFISTVFGARLRLTSILINKKIHPESQPADKSKCGVCRICVEKCPAQAATGGSWDINTDRDVFFDAFKCREKCGELARTHLKVNRRICGICIAVCPIGRIRKS
jgi:epoxyqueuosine reductase